MISETTLRKLYCDRRFSMMEIARELRTTHAVVLYWLKKYGIPRRSWSESTYVTLNPKGDPFTIPTRLSKRQQSLLLAGLLLYWAEGSKTQGCLELVNLDSRMLQVFMMFFREVCHVDESRLRIRVRVHQQCSLRVARQYWAKQFHLPQSQVLVYPNRDQRSKAHKQWSKYGIATLQFHSTKLKRWLGAAIEEHLRALLDKDPNARVTVSPERFLDQNTATCFDFKTIRDGEYAYGHSVMECDSLRGQGWLAQFELT